MLSRKSYKLILIGDPRVGKTTLRRRYMGLSAKTEYIATLGVEFSIKRLMNNTVAIQVWDLAGQSGFAKIRKAYYAGASVAFVLFDMTSPESLENLDYWFDEIKGHVRNEIPIALIGNKIDLIESHGEVISREKIENTIKELTTKYEFHLEYFTTSSLTGENVDHLFQAMLALIDSND